MFSDARQVVFKVPAYLDQTTSLALDESVLKDTRFDLQLRFYGFGLNGVGGGVLYFWGFLNLFPVCEVSVAWFWAPQ